MFKKRLLILKMCFGGDSGAKKYGFLMVIVDQQGSLYYWIISKDNFLKLRLMMREDRPFRLFIFINIHASNNKHYNTALFPNIESKISQVTSKFPFAKIIWGDDFNTTLNQTVHRNLEMNYRIFTYS